MAENETCGLAAALGVIAGKWKATIIWRLHEGAERFGALRRKLPGISEKILSEQLRQLEADGIVRRRDFGEVPPRVEYSLTGKGDELNEAVHRLSLWGTRHIEGCEPPASRARIGRGAAAAS